MRATQVAPSTPQAASNAIGAAPAQGRMAEAVADVDEGALARMIASHSATVDGPICSAAANRRAGGQKAYRRCALGMCSGIVVWRCFTGERAWLATRGDHKG